MVKNLLSNAGNTGSILGQGTKIPYATGQLSLHIATTGAVCSWAHAPQQEKPTHSKGKPQLENAHILKGKIPSAATETRCSQK